MTAIQYEPVIAQVEHKTHGKCVCEACNCGTYFK